MRPATLLLETQFETAPCTPTGRNVLLRLVLEQSAAPTFLCESRLIAFESVVLLEAPALCWEV